MNNPPRSRSLEMPAPEDLSVLPVTCSETIPEDFLDVMGHMNVMWYTHLFDRSIYASFALIGLDVDYMRNRRSGCFALESHLRYLAEVRAGNEITIRTRALGRTEKRFHLLCFMINNTSHQLAATFEVVGGHIDMNIRRMAPMPDDITARLDALIAEHARCPWTPPVCGAMAP